MDGTEGRRGALLPRLSGCLTASPPTLPIIPELLSDLATLRVGAQDLRLLL